ncbi:hypothetical protein CFP56_008649 [Quercus suber]|uniref:Uncharacterized protein n=1 Tax=Quercus suber TaxID=58331 RepID=A0AAW0M6Z5_QUESU
MLVANFRDYREHRSELLMGRTLEDFDLLKKIWPDYLRHKIFWFARKTAMHASKAWAMDNVIRSHKIIVIYSISAIILRQSCSEIIIALGWTTGLLNHYLLFTLINLENHITVNLLPLQFQKRVFGVISNAHAGRSIWLETIQIASQNISI